MAPYDVERDANVVGGTAETVTSVAFGANQRRRECR